MAFYNRSARHFLRTLPILWLDLRIYELSFRCIRLGSDGIIYPLQFVFPYTFKFLFFRQINPSFISPPSPSNSPPLLFRPSYTLSYIDDGDCSMLDLISNSSVGNNALEPLDFDLEPLHLLSISGSSSGVKGSSLASGLEPVIVLTALDEQDLRHEH